MEQKTNYSTPRFQLRKKLELSLEQSQRPQIDQSIVSIDLNQQPAGSHRNVYGKSNEFRVNSKDIDIRKLGQKNWQGLDIYHGKGKAIRFLSSFKSKKNSNGQGETEITLDNCPESEIQIRKIAQGMLKRNKQAQKNGNSLQQKNKVTPIRDVVLRNYHLQEGRYAVYSSATQNSSQNELVPKFQHIDDIAQSLKGQVTKKIIYFVMKIQQKKGQGSFNDPSSNKNLLENYKIRFIKNKGFGKIIPVVNIIAIKNNAILCSAQTISTINRFKFVLEHKKANSQEQQANNQNFILQSKECNFGGNPIQTNIDFSYSFRSNAKIQMNILEELIIYILLAPQQLKESIIKLAIKNSEKIIKEFLNIDGSIKALIDQSSQKTDYLYLLAKIMGQTKINEPRRELSALYYLFITQIAQNSEHINFSCQTKVNYQILQKVLFFIISDSRRRQNNQLPFRLMIEIVKKCMESLFNYQQADFVRQILRYCIKNRDPLISEVFGFGTFLERFSQLTNNNPGQYTLSILMSIHYYSEIQQVQLQLKNVLLQFFKNKSFSQDAEDYENFLPEILMYIELIYKHPGFSIDTIPAFLEFERYFYRQLKAHPILKAMVDLDCLNEKLKSFAALLNSKSKEEKFLEAIQVLYVTSYDSKIVSRNKIVSIIQNYLNDNKNWKSSSAETILGKFFYALLKRKDYALAQNLLHPLLNYLQKLGKEKGMKIINSDFNVNVISTPESMAIFKTLFLERILQIYYPKCKIADTIKQDKWHFDFAFKREINDIIVENIVKQIQYTEDHNTRKAQRKKIEDKIKEFVNNDQIKDSLISIVQIDTIEINQKQFKRIFYNNPSLLMVLLKIKDREDQKSASLKRIIQNQLQYIREKSISLNQIQYLNSLTLYQKNAIIMLFNDDRLFFTLEAFQQEAIKYLEQIQRYRRFFDDLHQIHKTQDPRQILELLLNAKRSIQEESIQAQNISVWIPALKTMNPNILECYTFRPFFADQNLKDDGINNIIDKSNRCFGILKQQVNSTQQKYKSGVLKIQDMMYFLKGDTLSPEQFQKIFSWQFRLPQDYVPIVQIYRVMKGIKKIKLSVNAVSELMKSFQQNNTQVSDYLRICEQIEAQQQRCDLSSLKKIKETYQQFLINKKKIPLHTPIVKEGLRDRPNKAVCNPKNVESLGKVIIKVIVNSHIMFTQHQFKQMVVLGKFIEEIKQELDQQQQFQDQITFQELQDFQDVIEYIKTVHEQSKKFNQYIQKLKKFLQRKSDLEKKIESACSVIGIIRELKEKLSDRNAGSKKFIDLVNTGIIFLIKKLSNGRNLFEFVAHGASMNQKIQNEKQFSHSQFIKGKDKAIMLLANIENKRAKTQQVLSIKRKIENFLQIQKLVDSVIKTENQLTSWGQIVFVNYDRKIVIQNGETKDLERFLQQRRQKLDDYTKRIANIYAVSFKAAMLQGPQIKKFYEFLIKEGTFYHPNFMEIASENQFKQFKKNERSTLRQQFNADPKQKNDIECLSLISRFFQSLKKMQNSRQAPDRDQQIIHLVNIPGEQTDYSHGIAQIGRERLQNLKREHILLCSQETGFQQLRSFIERALRDIDNQYIILDLKQLSAKKQQYLKDRVDQYRMQLKKKGTQLKLKICLIGDSTMQIIYEFMKQLQKQRPKIANQTGVSSIGQKQVLFDKFIQEKSEGVKIYKSKNAGMGKTFQIQQQCKRDNVNPIYFPISGKITEADIYKRIKQIASEREKAQGTKYSLIIQLYNISSVKIVNNFLLSIIMFRGVSSNAKTVSLAPNTKIYIEIQNVRKFDHMKQLSFLNTLVKAKSHITQITQISKACYKKNDLKFNYVVRHLDLLKSKKINFEPIQKFQQCKKDSQIQSQKIDHLINYYFWDRMKEEGQDPNFYQYQYWLRLVFQACKNFSASLAFNPQQFQNLYGAQFLNFLKLNSLREDFLQIVVDNARAFIKKTVSFEGEAGQGQLRMSKELQQFPFFIMPDVNGESFSYIYKDHRRVPIPIRNFLLTQNFSKNKAVGQLIATKNLPQEAVAKRLDEIFAPQSLSALESSGKSKEMNQALQTILKNISGNDNYKISVESGYVINLDNFFKMCLIIERSRQNIPIVIMGEAGVGKTTLLRYVVTRVLQHQFEVFNINAGVDFHRIKEKLQEIQRTAHIIDEQKQQAKELLKEQNKLSSQQIKIQKNKAQKKLWVFFDQFNTSQQLGYIKQLMMEMRFYGQKKAVYQNIVVVAACNPYRQKKNQNYGRKLQEKHQNNIGLVRQKKKVGPNKSKQEDLAFKVHPPPNSMVACMWNYGELGNKQTQKYVAKMLSTVQYKRQKTIQAILHVHQFIKNSVEISAVSLRDIERFRFFYHWFFKNLPNQPNLQFKDIFPQYEYENRGERAFIMAFTFCYLLRFPSAIQRKTIVDQVENIMGYNQQLKFQEKQSQAYMVKVKQFQEADFYSRLVIDLPGIAANKALKQNIFSCFVSIYMKMPMIIVGSPGCSKSLSVRILLDNIKFKRSGNQYLEKFANVRVLTFQGSQTCESTNVEKLFNKAEQIAEQETHKKQIIKDQKKKITDRLIPLIVFDQIGLAEQSPDNPLKVLHPYLEVDRQNNEKSKKQNSKSGHTSQRKIAFIGISNWELDLSKMSRFLIIRRPQLSKEDLIETALSISKKFTQDEQQSKNIVQKLSLSYTRFVQQWRARKVNDYRNFFGLRDFYSLIKCFWEIIQNNKIGMSDAIKVQEAIQRSIFKNFSGRNDSFQEFLKIYIQVSHKITKKEQAVVPIKKFDVVQILLESLGSKNSRCPLVIVPDNSSVSFLKYKIENSFGTDRKIIKQREPQNELLVPKNSPPFEQILSIVYEEGSHFKPDQQDKSYIFSSLTSIISCVQFGQILILNNINPTVQTALYDLFNKSYIIRGGNSICKVTLSGSSYDKSKQDQYYFVDIDSQNQQQESPENKKDSGSGGLTSNVRVHPDFNSLVIVHEKDLLNVEAPFLNRFEKYQFNLADYATHNTRQVQNKFKNLQKKLIESMTNRNEENKSKLPYQKEHLFVNWQLSAIKTLILKEFIKSQASIPLSKSNRNELQEEKNKLQSIQAKVIQKVIMNTTQDFYFVFKCIIDKSPDFPSEYKKLINKAVSSKFNFDPRQQTNKAIVFTTDMRLTCEQLSKEKNQIMRDQQQEQVQVGNTKKNSSVLEIDLSTIQNQQHLLNQITKAYDRSGLFVGPRSIRPSRQVRVHNQIKQIHFKMSAKTDYLKVDYIDSLIKKVQKRNIANTALRNYRELRMQESQMFTPQQVKIYLIFEIDRTNQSKSLDKGEISISYLNDYDQLVFQGDNVENKKDFFSQISMRKLLQRAEQNLTFTFQNQAQLDKLTLKFNQYKNYVLSDNSLLSRLTKKVILKIESMNMKLSEQEIESVISNEQIFRRCKNIREALASYLSQGKFNGLVSMFIKYLCDKDVFLSLDSSVSINFMDEELSPESLKQLKTLVKNQNLTTQISHICTYIVENKIEAIKNEFNQTKRLKQLPSLEKKKNVSIRNLRLFPFSKSQCEAIIKNEDYDKKSLTKLAEQYCFSQQKQKQLLTNFRKTFRQKSTFILNRNKPQKQQINLYHQIDSNGFLSRAFFLDLLSDFLSSISMRRTYLMEFEKTLSGFLMHRYFQKAEDRALLLLGYRKVWTTVFKFHQVFYDQGIVLPDQHYKSFIYNEARSIKSNIQRFVDKLIISFSKQKLMPDNANVAFLKGEENYFKIFKNAIFQLQNLEKTGVIKKSQLKQLQNVFIMRNFFTFIESYNNQNKIKILKIFITYHGQEVNYNCFKAIFDFLEDHMRTLKQQQNLENLSYDKKIKSIMTYAANELFFNWFKQQADSPTVLQKFLVLCDKDHNFSHNSVNTLNYLINLVELNFKNIQSLEQQLNEAYSQVLKSMGSHCKKNNYQNNLSILFVNVFSHHLAQLTKPRINQGVSFNKQILTNNYTLFKQFYNKVLLLNQSTHPLAPLFYFSYIKQYLENYVEALEAGQDCQQMKNIDQVLSQSNASLTKSCRLFCLKLLRRKRPTKQIDTNYIKIKIYKWPLKMQADLKEQESRSFMVPKENSSQSFKLKLEQFQQSQGNKTELFKQIFEEGSKSPENRYCLLNFFMRFIFSKAYTITYYSKIRTAFDQIKNSLIDSKQYLPQEIQLISRYIDSKVNQKLQVVDQDSLDQNIFIVLNNINWMFAIRKQVSPFTSLFFNNQGQIRERGTFFDELQREMFVLSSHQNPFIKIGYYLIEFTRSERIGIYLCGKQCDYLYMHGDCGWPKQVTKCPYCEANIGSKTGSHQLAGVERGARRVTSKKVVDARKFWCWNMTDIDLYWQGQRCYIQAEINRMNCKKQILIDKKLKRMTGYHLQKTDRISEATYHLLKFILQSQFYILTSLGVFKQQFKNAVTSYKQLTNMFGKAENNQNVITHLENQVFEELAYLSKTIDIKNKFNGWMYGIQRKFYEISIDFGNHVSNLKQKIEQKSNTLAQNLIEDSKTKKRPIQYKQVYEDIAEQLKKNKLISKEILQIQTNNAKNAFNRDLYENLINLMVADFSFDKKFDFAVQNQQLQGKLQYPFEPVLMEDQTKEEEFPYSKVLKIPQAPITLLKVRTQYEMVIKENYPFLQYLLTNYEILEQFEDYYNVISFINKLMKEVQYRKTRDQCQKITLREVLVEIKNAKGEGMPQQLKNPEKMLRSWVRLAKSLGVLQNACKVIGKMNDQYSLDTEIKAFILDNSSKQNPQGLMIGSVFHNFAKSYNQVLSTLNSRKNKIHEYRNLNLLNTQVKLHPQSISSKENLVLVNEEEIIKKLTDSSINSIIYGQNVYFHNFNMMQDYFIKKLDAKCELISELQAQKNICYNGQAFSQGSQSSSAIGQVRIIGQKMNWQPMPEQIQKDLSQYISKMRSQKSSQDQYYKQLIEIRGFLQKILVLIKNKEGNIKVQTFDDFNRAYHLEINHPAFQEYPISEMDITYIVDTYQIIEQALEPYTLQKIPIKYAQKFEQKETALEIERILYDLVFEQAKGGMMEEGNGLVSLKDLQTGLFRFISRTLIAGSLEPQNILMQFLSARQDFWPRNFDQSKIQLLSYKPIFQILQSKNAKEFLAIIKEVKTKKERR